MADDASTPVSENDANDAGCAVGEKSSPRRKTPTPPEKERRNK
jgi:hypothetical protein